ncbi:carbohydrate ABC transporter permease [Ruminiclostridium cellobioparum]|uniref:ABC-type sugar transport system, permease component n=1 Tax=Ruminiclostridium cellobioparum subsp. termitidis CT1112 TaxID=1195236 RepID=S0FEZ2_RUMCE|nr:carbohydrate ABC transporter permease [Ruminiclostridium cellobioparum]EMS69070.1 ABC-type sugar transport system, permease component [Ruminiclostridium cellobioparum subsp. termitidis CT1112]
MVVKHSNFEKIFDLFNVLLLGVLSLVFLYPIVYVAFASLSDPAQLVRHTGILLWPQGFSLSGYEMVWSNPNIGKGYMNTIFYVIVGTAINLLLTSMGAYVLSRKGFYLRRILTMGVVFTMYFSGGLIPFYLTVKGFGLYDSRLALILPVAINTWNLIVMRTSMAQIPASLEEAAKIDGANDFGILFRIFIPVIKSTMAVIILFYAVQHWNSWFNAMIFLRERGKYPLQLFLREILLSGSMMDVTAAGGEDVNNALTLSLLKYCTIVVSTLPILLIYPFLQKYFAKGVMIGSVKE